MGMPQIGFFQFAAFFILRRSYTLENSISQSFTASKLMRFTLPSIIMMLFLAICSMFCSIFAANYVGEDALSAINIVFPLISTVLAVAIMFAAGSNAIIASNLGSGDYEKAKQNFTAIFIFGTIIGVIFSIISLLFKTEIIHFLGSTPELQVLCEEYLTAYVLVFPFIFWQVYAQYFFVTIGKPVFGMGSVIIGGICNITLAYLSMAVWNLGILGAALGAATGSIIPGIIFVIYFSVKKDAILCFVKPKRHKKFLINTCSNGSSEMVTNLAIAIVTAILNIIMMKLAGKDGIAAVSVIVQVQFLLNSTYIGFGGGVAPIFAYAKGENNSKQIKTVFKLSIRFVAISSIVLVVLSLIFADNIVGAFISPESSAYELAKTGFVIFSIGYFFAGTNIFASVFFTSLSNGKISAIISFLRTFAFILGMLLVLPLLWGTTGVWLAIPIAESLALLVSIWFLKKYKTIYHY